jgi:hypothetical protein
MYDFHITPKSEDELTDLLPEDRYPYQIVKSTSKEKNGFMQMIWSTTLPIILRLTKNLIFA